MALNFLIGLHRASVCIWARISDNVGCVSNESLRWRYSEWDGVSNHQPRDCLLNCLSGRRSKKTSKPSVTGLCVMNSPGTGEFPAQMASNAEAVSIWWRHHVETRHCRHRGNLNAQRYADEMFAPDVKRHMTNQRVMYRLHRLHYIHIY